MASSGLFAHPPTPLTLASSLRVDPGRGVRVAAGSALAKKERDKRAGLRGECGRVWVAKSVHMTKSARTTDATRTDRSADDEP